MTTLGLCMIAKNESHTLCACIQSAAGIVSQVVVADTGSTDSTTDVARGLGAVVLSVPWQQDFSKARNAALQAVQTDWVLVLDADEELDRDAIGKIAQLIQNQSVGGYLTPIRNYVPTTSGRGWDRAVQPNDSDHPRAKTAPAYFVHENCRLFRRNAQIYFTGRVHELVEPSIEAAGFKLLPSDVYIHHFGHLVVEETRKKKAAIYLDLLRLKVKELPNDPLAWLQLGLQEYECTREADAPLRCFEKALELEPRAIQGWVFKGMIHLDHGNYQQALADLGHVRKDHASQALCEHLRGDAFHNLGRLKEARASYARSVRLTNGDPVVVSKLGYTELRLGLVQQGTTKLQRAVEASPDMPDLRERLMKAYIAADQLLEAGKQADEIAKLDRTAKSWLRAASIWNHAGQKGKAQSILRIGAGLFPESPELRNALAELTETPRAQKANIAHSTKELS